MAAKIFSGVAVLKQWHLAEFWEIIADAIPEAPAIVEGDRRDDWRTYEQRSARIAAALKAQGIAFDTKVALCGYNSKAYLEAQFAILKLRGVPVNVNYHYGETELEYLLDNADAEAIVFDAQFGARIAAVRDRLPALKTLVEIDDGSGLHLEGALRLEALARDFEPLPRQAYSPDDVFMFYTGGTTGQPKGVMFRQGDFIEICLAGYVVRGLELPDSAAALADVVRVLQRDGAAPVTIPACPFMHGAGLWAGVFMTHNVGGSVVIYRNEKFDVDRLWALAEREHATDIVIVGDAFARPMVAGLERAVAAGRPVDLSALRVIFSSGVMFSKEVKEALLSFADIVIRDTMGATEGSMAGMEVSRASPPAETSRFFPNPNTKVFLEDGIEVVPGSDEVGLVANGGALPIGYYKDEAKTAATFRIINGRRYGVPGDYARIAADGSLILVGRGSGCINTGGEKVFAEEVEKVLSAHPDVEDCLVTGAPDERFGQRVVALVSLTGSRDVGQDDLIAFVRRSLAGYKAPRQIIFVDAVQRGANGKPDYKWAKAVVDQDVVVAPA